MNHRNKCSAVYAALIFLTLSDLIHSSRGTATTGTAAASKNSLADTNYLNRTTNDSAARNGRFFPLFNIVTFRQGECMGQVSSHVGTCMTFSQCAVKSKWHGRSSEKLNRQNFNPKIVQFTNCVF